MLNGIRGIFILMWNESMSFFYWIIQTCFELDDWKRCVPVHVWMIMTLGHCLECCSNSMERLESMDASMFYFMWIIDDIIRAQIPVQWHSLKTSFIKIRNK